MTVSIILRRDPVCKLFQFGYLHSQYQFLTMDSMNSEDVVGLKQNRTPPLQFVEPGFDQWIVDNPLENRPLAFRNLHPEVFPPSA